VSLVARGARAAIEAIARIAGGGPRPLAESSGIVVERGSGSYLFDGAGASYLDLVSGHGVASIGHSHPHWVRAVVEQAGRLTVSPLHTDPLARYLEALSARLPPQLARVGLCSTGAEAVEMAVRLAQTATGRPGVLTFKDGFHGKTAAVRYTANPEGEEARFLAPGWMRTAPFPACERHDVVSYPGCEEEASAELAVLVERADLAEVGAVLVEPVLGTAGCIPAKRTFLPELRRLCDEQGWLLLLDESITGFGRTGEMFAFEWFGVVPDAVVLSKGLGGGFPLSAVCAAAELWDESALAAPSATSSSYGGNPLACAAGLATLEVIAAPGFLEQVRAVAGYAGTRLRELADASPRVARPRGVGLMLGFDQVEPESGELAGTASCEVFLRACRERGVVLPAHVPRVRVTPPLTVTEAEVEELFGALFEVLA
jgi:4-aminobutyrate aminotransferase-like enzyme